MTMFHVRYVASACLVISTTDLRILCDPWFTDGVYEGSWYTYPKTENPIDLIGDVDFIYISHIHPDHYDPKFLRNYFRKYGTKQLLIPSFYPNHLLHKASLDGFQARVVESFEVGNTKISITPNLTGSISDIDSALIVTHSGMSFLNLNDNVFNDSQNQAIHDLLEDLRFAAIGYSPAGPYPQTYFNDEESLTLESQKIRELSINKFLTYMHEFQPKAALPFAGQYVLGGQLHSLNEYRGCPDATDLLGLDPRVVVLSDSPDSHYDLVNQRVVGSTRVEPYSIRDYATRIREISRAPLSYEIDLHIEESRLPIHRLLKSAYFRAHDRSECNTPYFFFIQTRSGEDGWLMSADRNSKYFERMRESEAVEVALARSASLSRLTIDYRLLFGLITGIYHWNNAEVGSLYRTSRLPNLHNRAAQQFLNFLQVV